MNNVGAANRINTGSQLVELVTLICFTASAQHAAVNYPQAATMTYTPAAPLAGYSPLPVTQKGSSEGDLLRFLQPAFGVIPGAGGAQHLARLMGRAQALEVMLSAQDYDADLAERYGWINRALPTGELSDFVKSLAHRIASFPAAGHAVVKGRVNAIALPTVEDIRRDSDLFLEGTRTKEFQELTQAAMKRGFQTRDAEMNLARLVGDLDGRGTNEAQRPA